MWLLILLSLLLNNSSPQNTPLYLRKTTLSHKYMQTFSFCYYRIVNGNYYSTWRVPVNTYYSDVAKYNLQFYFTTSLNSITSGANTYGFQIAVRRGLITDTWIDLTIVDSIANKYSDPLVWYSVRIFIFMLPQVVPFRLVYFQIMIYSTIGQNLYTLTNQTSTYYFPIDPTFLAQCYWDQAKTVKDKIHLIPSLLQLYVINPEYVNLTSKSNWVYDWNSSTMLISFDLTISAYNSTANYAVMDLIGLCPNSYKFSQYNLSMAVSSKNWFNFQPINSIQNRYRSVFLQYPFSNDTAVLIGMPITGLSIYSRNFNTITTIANTSLMIVSFNITQSYDLNGEYTGYLGNLSYNVVNPQNCYGLYYMFGTLGGCPNNLVQYNITHCKCPPGTIFSYTSGKCLNCKILYGDLCGTCNETQCLGCSNGLYFYKSSNKSLCINCSALYGDQCVECSDSKCMKCSNNYTINASNKCQCHLFENFIDFITGVCIQCPLKFPFCINCTYNGCFGCLDRFTVSNNSCVCFFPNILALGSCFSCPDLFGLGCILCNSSSCVECDTNFQLINNTCQCLGRGFTLFNQKCLKCSELFGEGCLICNISNCLRCDYNYELDSTNCTCPALVYAITQGKCQSCTLLYPYCKECNSSTCHKCLNNFQNINNNCVCSGDRYLTLGGGCQLCINVHENCNSCNRSACWSCFQNFTLVNGRCMCLSPLIKQGTSCLNCQDLKNSQLGCSVSMDVQYYQSGTSLYFWLKYNTLMDQIKFSSPLQFNIIIKIGDDQASFRYDPQTEIFVVDLSHLNSTSIASVQLLKKQMLLSDGRQLFYNSLSFTVSPVPNSPALSSFINYLSVVRNYAICITLLLSMSVFSRLSKSLNIMIIMCLSRQNLPNSIGLVSDIFNINSPFHQLNLQIGWNLKIIECSQLRFVAYGLNKSIIDQCFTVYLAGLISVLLIAYIRGYLQTKQKVQRHLAWRNLLAHSKQYLLQNVLNLHGLLCFPALLQLKLILQTGSAGITLNIASFLFSIFLLTMPCLLIAICLIKYPYQHHSYSVLYNGLQSGKLTVFCWLLTTLQPYVISIFTAFIPQHYNLYVMISINALCLIVWVLCVGYILNKVEYVFTLLKQICVLYVSISLVFNREDWLLLIIGAYCILAVCLLQILQILFKTTLLILVNKGLIQDYSHNQIKAYNKQTSQARYIADSAKYTKQEPSSLLAMVKKGQ